MELHPIIEYVFINIMKAVMISKK